MAITAQQKANLLGVTSFMFNFAPDQASYARFEARIEANPSFYALGTDLARTEAYTSQFAEGATRAEKIDLILGRLGLTEGEGYERGVNFINQRLDAGIPEGQVLMEIGEKLLQDTPPTGLEDAAAILKNKMAASEAYLESGIEGYSSETLPDLLANITADAASVEEAQAAIDEIKPGVPGDNFSLTANADVLEGTANNDSFTATDTTYNAGDVILGGSGNDTLTIEAAAGNAAAATVAGVENVVFNAKSFTNLAFNAENVVGNNTTITFNNTQTAGATGGTVNNVGSGATVVAGSQMTGTFTVDLTDTATGVTVNGGNAGTVNVTEAGQGGVTVVSDKVGTANTPVNISVDGDGDATAGTANDAATVKAKGVVNLNTQAAAGNQVENLTLAGNGQAVTYNLDATATQVDAPEKITFTGDQDVTLVGGAAQFDTETATDNTTAGTTTIRINDDATADLSKLAVDLITIADGTTGAVTYSVANNANVKLVADTKGGVIDSTVAANTDSAETLNLEIDDLGDQTLTTDIDDFETVNLSTSDSSATTGDSKVTINDLKASKGQNSVVNITGAVDLVLSDVEATKIAAGDFTGKLTALLSADMKNITTGSGDDTFNAYDGDFTVVAGAGNDTLNFAAATDLSNDTVSLTGVESIVLNAGGAAADATEVVKFKSSVIDSASYIVKGTGATNLDTLDVVLDSTSVDLSKLVVDTTTANVSISNGSVNGLAQNILGSNGADTLTSTGSGAVTMNGNAGADVITTAGGNDVINGGAGNDRLVTGTGNDSVTGGEGADHIIAGAGGDTIDLTETTSAQDAVVFAALTDGSAAGQAAGTFTGHDVITGFESGSDKFVFDSNYQFNGAVDTAIGTTLGANAVVVSGTDGSTNNLDVTAADATNVDSMLAFFQDVLGSNSTTGDAIVAVNFGDSSAFYNINDGGDAIAAGEIQLLGVVDSAVAQVDFVTA